MRFNTGTKNINDRKMVNTEDIASVVLSGEKLIIQTKGGDEIVMTYVDEIKARTGCEEIHELIRRGTDARANRLVVQVDSDQILVVHLDKLEVVRLYENFDNERAPDVFLDYSDRPRKILNFPDRATAEATYASIVGRILAHSV